MKQKRVWIAFGIVQSGRSNRRDNRNNVELLLRDRRDGLPFAGLSIDLRFPPQIVRQLDLGISSRVGDSDSR